MYVQHKNFAKLYKTIQTVTTNKVILHRYTTRRNGYKFQVLHSGMDGFSVLPCYGSHASAQSDIDIFCLS